MLGGGSQWPLGRTVSGNTAGIWSWTFERLFYGRKQPYKRVILGQGEVACRHKRVFGEGQLHGIENCTGISCYTLTVMQWTIARAAQIAFVISQIH